MGVVDDDDDDDDTAVGVGVTSEPPRPYFASLSWWGWWGWGLRGCFLLD